MKPCLPTDVPDFPVFTDNLLFKQIADDLPELMKI